MHNLLIRFGISMFAVVSVLGTSTAFGLDAVGRGGRTGARASSVGTTARMPSMPVMPINAIGNMAQNIPSNPTAVPTVPNNPNNPGTPDVTPKCPTDATGTYPDCICNGAALYNSTDNKCVPCEYSGMIVVNGACACPTGMHTDAATKSCVADAPTPECPDGGVKNSEYDVARCMNDVYSCVNGGALPNGINDMFNEDLRNSIENGMALCAVQVDKCVNEIRRDCKNIYRSSADVWIDFNARKVQPDYYNFVLRKTGLTPIQAENTCLLLDRNTYGSSFAAVANDGKTTTEYNNKVGAFNGQNGNVLVKKNPQGATINTGHKGVDGQRGHYARWDAVNAECYIRVAAYNKDTHIKNTWLFGAAGDDRPAEVWKKAGETFSCNKDLFGFSLMNDTSTAAVVGIGGGTLLGAGIGAAAGHGAREFSCANDDHRKKLLEQIKTSGKLEILNEFLPLPIDISAGKLSKADCDDIYALYQRIAQASSALASCADQNGVGGTVTIRMQELLECDVEIKKITSTNATITQAEIQAAMDTCYEQKGLVDCKGKSFAECQTLMAPEQIGNMVMSAFNAASGCQYRSMVRLPSTIDLMCTTSETGCINADKLSAELARLKSGFAGLDILNGEKNNRLKTTLVGAGIGAGAGGLATGITALIEHNNINCRVGDGLNRVGFGKSHSIDTLKDFYVKWNLRLPDTITPTGTANDCNSWRALCGAYTDMDQCKMVQLNYRGLTDKTMLLVPTACTPSGSRCIENYSVAKSYGACE